MLDCTLTFSAILPPTRFPTTQFAPPNGKVNAVVVVAFIFVGAGEILSKGVAAAHLGSIHTRDTAMKISRQRRDIRLLYIGLDTPRNCSERYFQDRALLVRSR